MKKILPVLVGCSMAFSIATFASAEDLETVTVPFMLTMNPAEDTAEVQAAINEELAKKDLNIQVELVGIDYASWTQQMTLMLADGSVDLFNCTFMPSVSVLANQGSIVSLNELLPEYGQGILDTIGDYIGCATIDGNIYGVPKVDAFSKAQLFFMNKTIADEVGIDPATITDYETLTEAFKKVHEAKPDLTVIANGTGGAYRDIASVDFLGTEDPLGCLILEAGSDDTTVVNFYETDAFKTMLAQGKEWDELGFFMKDPLNAQDGAFSYLANGQAFGGFGSYASAEVGKNIQEKANAMDLYVVQVVPDSWATTANVTAMTWCVAELSDHKEAAVKLLNELYTNPTIANLVCNGIEGKQYVVTEDGSIDYAEGLDAFSTGWPSGMGTFWPNITITYPWTPDPADVYEDWLSTNENCQKSPALGFSFDASNVSDEISACAGVVDQYYTALLLNIGDTDALYKEFLEALSDAGIEDIVAEKQAQLDAWKAEQ